VLESNIQYFWGIGGSIQPVTGNLPENPTICTCSESPLSSEAEFQLKPKFRAVYIT
jgi:hypothetical protein